MLVLAFVTLSVLVALGVERLSYQWCPWMGAMWTTCCDRGDRAGKSHDEPTDAPRLSAAPCCETRGFKALPTGEQAASRDTIRVASEVATPEPMFVARIDVEEVAPTPGAAPRGGVPPPSRQRRLALISLLRL